DALYDRLYDLYILNKSFYEAQFDDPAQDLYFVVDGTGPYVLENKDTATGNMTFKRTGKYWGERGYIDTINMIVLKGDMEMAFETGDVDFASYMPTTISKVEGYDNVQTKTYYSDSVTYLICNSKTGASPMTDIRVREAVQYAFDRDDLAYVATDGAESPPTTSFIPR
ncbi:MAG: hypothetical protein II689_00420, partial [Firmicutes bacterium]|nr:hypothetical protein [Bacillota bacterium]